MSKIISNRIINHEYFIEERYECGLELVGNEVKSIRAGKANLKDSFGKIKDMEVFLVNMHISPNEFGNRFNVDPIRTRKLLMHKTQIITLYNKVKQGGYTLVPSKLYFSGKNAKIELCLCKGKKDYDKRNDLKKKDAMRDMKRYI